MFFLGNVLPSYLDDRIPHFKFLFTPRILQPLNKSQHTVYLEEVKILMEAPGGSVAFFWLWGCRNAVWCDGMLQHRPPIVSLLLIMCLMCTRPTWITQLLVYAVVPLVFFSLPVRQEHLHACGTIIAINGITVKAATKQGTTYQFFSSFAFCARRHI